MRKKIGVIVISLICTFSIVYTMDRMLLGSSSTIDKPFNMNFGYSVYWTDLGGLTSPSPGEIPIEWYVIANGFGDRTIRRDAPDDELTLLSKERLSEPMNSSSSTGAYRDSDVRTFLNNRFNNSTLAEIEASVIKKQLVYDITSTSSIGIVSSGAGTKRPISPTADHPGDYAYSLSTSELNGDFNNEYGVDDCYFTGLEEFASLLDSDRNVTNIWLRSRRSIVRDNMMVFNKWTLLIGGQTVTTGRENKSVVQPVMQLDQSKVALATSISDTEKLNMNVANKVKLVESSKTDKLKVALKRSDVKIIPLNGSGGTRIVLPDLLKIDYSLESTSTVVKGSNHFITLALTQKNSNNDDVIKYHGRVEELLSTPSGSISVDISYLPVGEKYDVKLYYEEVNAGLVNYNYASQVADFGEIEIGSTKYDKTPQLPDLTKYEYDKNVESGDKVGKYTFPGSTARLTTNILAPEGHSNDYLNFELDRYVDGGMVVKIKSNAPDIVAVTKSLAAKDYYFCMVVQEDGVDVSGSEICEKITVNKTTPTISFTDTTIKDITIGDSVYAGDINYSNTDAVVPGNISYALTNGISGGVLTVVADSVNPKKYNANVLSSYTGTSLPTTFDLNVTIAETDNYKSATTTVKKQFFVYKDLSNLNWSPTKTGSYSTTDVGANAKVGSLLASDGVEKFTYEFAKQGDTGFVQADAADNPSFTIANGSSLSKGISAEVKTTSQLTEKTYKLQFKVTDSKGKVVYKSVEIVVNAQNQNPVEFKTGTSGSVITEYKMKVNEKSRSLFAEGGSTGATIEYYLANASDQPSGLVGSASDYADIAKIGGLISPKKVGTINVYAKSPGNATYGDRVSSFMNLIIEQAEQSVKFANTNATSIKIGDTSQETATGTVTLTNDPGVGGITYDSSDKNVATVDANGKVTAIAKGTAIITATLNDSDSSNTSYNPNYETKTTTKTINVYKGMSLTWTASLPNLKGVSSGAGDLAGIINVIDNNGNITYTISSNTGVENADAKFFQLDPNNTSCGVKLVGSIAAADVAGHNNKFYIQVDVADSKDTQTIDIEITIDNAENDAYFKEGTNKVTKITKQYGEANNTFNLSVNTSNGGSVTYSVVTTQPQDVITTLGTGVTTIKKVGTTKVQAVVGAGSGYDGKTISVDVEITKGIQEVSFDDTATTARAFVKDSQFSEPTTLSETSAKTKSSRTKTYDSKDTSICTVDQAGLVTMLTKGNCEIEVKNTDSNWNTTTATKVINLYDGMGVVFAQSATPQAETPSATTNSIVGKLTISGGQGSKTSIVSTGADSKNKDAKFFEVKGTNVVLKQNITAIDLANKYDTVKQKYVMYVQFETKDSLSTTITTDAIIEFKGAPLNAEFDTNGTGKITEVYGKDRIFLADVINNIGGGTPVYQLKNDLAMPSDVLKSVDPDGTITIANANDKATNANPVMIEAVIPPSGGYEGKTVEVEVEIVKAEQTGFKFKTPTIKMQTESTLSVILEGKLSTGNTKISSPNTIILNVNGMDITAGKTEDTLTVTGVDDGDRNYKMAFARATVIISKQAAYPFIISVPNATYGDTGLKAKIDTNGATGANQVQTWVSSDPTIADIDASGNITIYQAGQVDITCTQTSTGEPSATSTATLVIQPKAITITINDKSKYVGESVPGFDMTIPNGVLVPGDTISLPNFSCLDTSNKPVTSTTPAGSYSITGTYPTGANPNYAITVTQGTLIVKQDASQASWYHLEGVTSGNTLDPTKWYNEDVKVVLDTATESAGTYDEISLDQTLWDATSITVTQEDENSEDVNFRINASGILSSSQPVTIKIDKTKPIVKSITGTQTNKDAISTLINSLTFGTFFKQGTLVSIKSEDILPSPNVKVSGIQEVAYEVYEIDRKTGIINSTPLDTGTNIPDVNGAIEVKLDDVGLYRVCAIAKDNAGNVSGESCSDVNIKKIDVDIDDDGENEYQDPDNDGCPDINIVLKDEKGTIYKINVDRDGDGIPDLNIDSDGDGIAEINVDTDKDEKPDLNLVILTKWEPTFCATEQIDNEGKPIEYCTMKDIKAVINIDTGKDTAGSPPDGIPDINIDTDGDMKANVNIDTNKNGKLDPADSNITSKLDAWKPGKQFTLKTFEYNTMDSLKAYVNIIVKGDTHPSLNIDTDGDGLPNLNVDSDGDGLPETNIDGNGDGEADINVDLGNDGTPDENILVLTEWKPEILVNGKVLYKTMEIKYEKKEELEDNGIVIRPKDPSGTFLPNYALKVKDVTSSISDEDKESISNITGKDSEVKLVYDVNLLKDGQVTQPDGSIEVRIPIDTSIKNPKILMQNEDGSWKLMDAKIDGDYFVFETDYIGTVSVVGDKVSDTDSPTNQNPSLNPPTVKGDYTGGVGGAGTGDSTDTAIYFIAILISLSALSIVGYKKLNKL